MYKKVQISILLLFLSQFLLISHVYPENKIVISSFSTSVADQDDAVKKNIRIALDRINGTLLQPGGIFSFNDIVGEGSAKNGFLPGRVLYRDQIRYEPGGGLCQLSSTIFNAFLLAGCAIAERHRHFQPVTYVPIGLDATIKYGKKDLRVKNSLSQNLYIKCSINDQTLAIIISGDKNPDYKYDIYTEEEEVSVPFEKDNENIRQGVSVLVYRKKIKADKIIENLLLYKDFYPPVLTK